MAIIETKRLALYRLNIDDAPFILELLNDPDWLQFIGDKNVKTSEDARNYILNGPVKSYEQFGFGLFLAKLKEGNIPIGVCGLLKRDYLDHADLGFAFLPAFRGQGYATESATAVLNYGKNRFGFRHILATSQTNNIKSLKALEKIGFVYERLIEVPGNDQIIQLLSVKI